MEIYFTADLHLGHQNIIRHANRPFDSLEEMDETLIERWNSVVGPKDAVYVLGDIAWQTPRLYLERLNGYKELIAGNHDRLGRPHIQGYTKVHQLYERKIDGQWVVMCHYSLMSWNRSSHGSWMLHGHSHGTLEESPHIFRSDVGVDVWDFYPVHWEDIKNKMELKFRQKQQKAIDFQQRRTAIRKANRDIMWKQAK